MNLTFDETVGASHQPVLNTQNVSNVQTTATDSIFQVMIANQENLAKRIIRLEKGLQEINSQLLNLCSWIKNNANSRPQSAMSTMSSASNVSLTTEPPSTEIIFKRIDDENDLLEFEKSIGDGNYRSMMCEHFVKPFSGAKKLISVEESIDPSKSVRSISLQLERQIFTENFWTKTAWTGGRKTEGFRKFVFATHVTFMGFFNDVIHRICGTQMSQIEFAEFVKNRTRNSGYIRVTPRITSARSARKRKHDAQEKEIIAGEASTTGNGPPNPASEDAEITEN